MVLAVAVTLTWTPMPGSFAMIVTLSPLTDAEAPAGLSVALGSREQACSRQA